MSFDVRAFRVRCMAVVLVAMAAVAVSADWPQFLGPERNGVYRGPALAETWPAKGPTVAWRKTVGQGFAFVFGFLGLLWNPFLIFIALFVYIGASQEAALAQMKDVSRRFPVSSAMVREFRTLAADATLEEAVDALLATSQHDFPVMDATGNVAGLLTRHDLIAALRKNDPTLRVGDVMRRDIPTVTTGTRFEDAFRIMQECDCPAVPVLDRMKRLVGLLTPENVTELMMVQSAMPQRRVL